MVLAKVGPATIPVRGPAFFFVEKGVFFRWNPWPPSKKFFPLLPRVFPHVASFTFLPAFLFPRCSRRPSFQLCDILPRFLPPAAFLLCPPPYPPPLVLSSSHTSTVEIDLRSRFFSFPSSFFLKAVKVNSESQLLGLIGNARPNPLFGPLDSQNCSSPLPEIQAFTSK